MDIWIYVVLIGIATGLVKGISGFGSSIVAIPLLLHVFGDDYLAQIIVIMVTLNLLLNSILLISHKGFHPRSLQNVWLISLLAVIFSVVGVFILINTPTSAVKYVAFGFVLLAILVKGFFLIPKFQGVSFIKDTPILKMIVGTLSGLGNGIASIDGPPVVFYLTVIKADKIRFKNTLAAHFIVTGITVVITHILVGTYTLDILWYSLGMTLSTVAGLLVGIRLSHKMNQSIFDLFVIIVLTGLAFTLLFR
jgi:uncharacterized membrane protein YfcA